MKQQSLAGRNSQYRHRLTVQLRLLLSEAAGGIPDAEWLLALRNLIYIQIAAEEELPQFEGRRTLFELILRLENSYSLDITRESVENESK